MINSVPNGVRQRVRYVMTHYNLAVRIWVLVLLLYLLSGLLQPKTLKFNQILNVLQVTSFLGVVGVGQTLVLLTGGIDLSVAGVMTLINLVSASIMNGQPGMILPAVLFCLGLGFVVGVINGLFITKIGITPLITTLAMNSILFGATLIYTGGAPQGAIPEAFMYVGQGRWMNIPVPTLIWGAFTVAAAVMLRKTTFGRRIFSVGDNPRAARVVGINSDAILIAVYGLCGLSASLAALLLTAYMGLPSIGIGDQYLLNSIAAVVVGGTALTGGVGSVLATAGGALFITQLNSVTNMLKMSTGTQLIVQGVIIAGGIAINTLQRDGSGELD